MGIRAFYAKLYKYKFQGILQLNVKRKWNATEFFLVDLFEPEVNCYANLRLFQRSLNFITSLREITPRSGTDTQACKWYKYKFRDCRDAVHLEIKCTHNDVVTRAFVNTGWLNFKYTLKKITKMFSINLPFLKWSEALNDGQRVCFRPYLLFLLNLLCESLKTWLRISLVSSAVGRVSMIFRSVMLTDYRHTLYKIKYIYSTHRIQALPFVVVWTSTHPAAMFVARHTILRLWLVLTKLASTRETRGYQKLSEEGSCQSYSELESYMLARYVDTHVSGSCAVCILFLYHLICTFVIVEFFTMIIVLTKLNTTLVSHDFFQGFSYICFHLHFY